MLNQVFTTKICVFKGKKQNTFQLNLSGRCCREHPLTNKTAIVAKVICLFDNNFPSKEMPGQLLGADGFFDSFIMLAYC